MFSFAFFSFLEKKRRFPQAVENVVKNIIKKSSKLTKNKEKKDFLKAVEDVDKKLWKV